jgi:hypothetical protein
MRPRKNPLTIDKICEGCKKTFTISYRKKHQRFCNKSCAQHCPSVLSKMKFSQKETSMKKYGVEHPMKTQGVVDNFKKSMSEKYGVESALKKEEFVNKSSNTKLDRYGDKNYNNKNKYKRTCLEKYGVDNPRKLEEINAKIKNTVMNIHYDYITEYCTTKKITPLFNYDEYLGYNWSNKYRFRCNVCKKEFYSDIYRPSNVFCEVCNPLDNDTLENELFVYINSILPKTTTIKRNDRTILFGKELDIYIPELKIAFELNGLYWHSEVGQGVNKYYHLNKYKSCISHGIKLIHIFENEWNHKKRYS